MPFVGDLDLKQFRVCEDDAELVVQLMKQLAQIGARFRRVGSGTLRLGRHIHAWCPAVVVALGAVTRGVAAASRHSVSVKIRIDPPAVRTYSTLPAEIQL